MMDLLVESKYLTGRDQPEPTLISLRTFMQTFRVNQRGAPGLSSSRARLREQISHWRLGGPQLTDPWHRALRLWLPTPHLGRRGQPGASADHREHLGLQYLRARRGNLNTPRAAFETLRVGILYSAVVIGVLLHAEDSPGVVAQDGHRGCRSRASQPTDPGPDLSSHLG